MPAPSLQGGFTGRAAAHDASFSKHRWESTLEVRPKDSRKYAPKIWNRVNPTWETGSIRKSLNLL